MKVSELKSMLDLFPSDMEVVVDRYSDYQVISYNDCTIVKGVPQSGGWVMESHESMTAENKAKEKQYLFLKGEP